MKIFKNYNMCIFCGSKHIKKEKKQIFINNFYTDAISSDLSISKTTMRKIKVYECRICFTRQHNPWFTDDISRKIYSNIYGQHNRSWENVLTFLKKGRLPNHGKLFKILREKIKIVNYAEFNSPFMGLFINFFSEEYKKKLTFYKKILDFIINYLTSRQVAGKTKRIKILSEIKSKKYLNNLLKLKKKNLIKRSTNKFLIIENNNLFWSQNDNYKSVNSKSFASQMLDLNIKEIEKTNKKYRYDLFGIFHTLDHTYKPKKILDYALNNSKYVIVYCHINSNLTKQHLFSFSKDFLKYLNQKKIYTIDMTNKIDKKMNSPELYFLCSKSKSFIKKIKI